MRSARVARLRTTLFAKREDLDAIRPAAAPGSRGRMRLARVASMALLAATGCKQSSGARLTVQKSGDGQGTVSSAPVGIDCGASCAATFPLHTAVALSATALAGSRFAGWSGACTGSSSCEVELAADAQVVASFALLPTAPGAPVEVTAVAGDRLATVSWTPPSNDGGSPLTGFVIAWSANGGGSLAVASGSATSAQVTGLTNGIGYAFTVAAINDLGTSPPSVPAAPVVPAGLPAAPVLRAPRQVSARRSWSGARPMETAHRLPII